MESTSTETGTMIYRSLEWFGDLGSFSWKVIRAALTRPFELREIIRQFDEIGSKSLPLVALAGGQGTVGAPINDKKIYTQLDQTTLGLRDTVTKAQAGVADFQENMDALKQNFLLRGYFKNRGYENSSDLAKNEIPNLPQAEPLKSFTCESKQLFDKVDTAKPKNQKSLRQAGQFLADNEFGVAVVAVSSGMTGDTQKDLVLTEARALVVRNYLVDNFGFEDAQLKTFGAGKKSDVTPGAGWGSVEIIVYPPGTAVPTN
jgi:outer membrane protein OmpA-like peptidoglycan-associated protein